MADEPLDGEVQLLDLAELRLEELTGDEALSVLDTILKRLFDPDKRDLVTVSAFGSAL